MAPMTLVAAAQIDVAFADKAKNLATIRDRIHEAVARGVKLVCFPECAVSGYAFESVEHAREVAEPVPGPATEAIAAAGAWTVVGMLERAGERVYNSAVLAGPGGVAHVYRKLHLPFLGVDRFAAPGDRALAATETPAGRVGLNICYDGSFPETGRLLKLAGAQLIVLPTNWPEQARLSIQHQSIVRAFENHVNYVAVNRVGSEGGFRFPGGSRIVDFTGRVLAEAGEEAALLVADLDLAGADRNRLVFVPGRYEIDRLAHRRTDMYGPLSR